MIMVLIEYTKLNFFYFYSQYDIKFKIFARKNCIFKILLIEIFNPIQKIEKYKVIIYLCPTFLWELAYQPNFTFSFTFLSCSFITSK